LYAHTQTGWPVRIAFGATALAVLVIAAIGFEDLRAPRAVFAVGAVIAVVFAVAWSRLSIRIDGDRLQWTYGPGWPRFSLPIADIASVDITRTTFLEGWGIHRTRRGWLYNIGGSQAVHIQRHDGRQLLLGTDEPRRLKAALERALAGAGRGRSRG
jgi:hypothetical protein